MADPLRRLPTYEDVLAAPPNVVAEILLGELHLSPRPARRHGRAASILSMDLGSAFERGRGGPGGWLVLTGERWVLHGTYRDDQVVHAPPFEAVGIELGSLWLPETP